MVTLVQLAAPGITLKPGVTTSRGRGDSNHNGCGRFILGVPTWNMNRSKLFEITIHLCWGNSTRPSPGGTYAQAFLCHYRAWHDRSCSAPRKGNTREQMVPRPMRWGPPDIYIYVCVCVYVLYMHYICIYVYIRLYRLAINYRIILQIFTINIHKP